MNVRVKVKSNFSKVRSPNWVSVLVPCVLHCVFFDIDLLHTREVLSKRLKVEEGEEFVLLFISVFRVAISNALSDNQRNYSSRHLLLLQQALLGHRKGHRQKNQPNLLLLLVQRKVPQLLRLRLLQKYMHQKMALHGLLLQ